MRVRALLFIALLAAPALYPATAASSAIRAAATPASALWEAPAASRPRDLFNGPWGAAFAPDPHATYTFVRHKGGGVNPGLVVRDPHGREWHVKQAGDGERGDEGPAEVALSRVLSGVGYHQPPVYYLPSFVLADGSGTHVGSGGRFRLSLPSMQSHGNWQWRDNPFVGTQPYNGLLAILLAFSSWDLKDSNNTIYDVDRGGRRETWYVVRDLGGSLGETGGLTPKRNNIEKFEREGYVDSIRHGFVEFSYHGKRQDLLHHRITVDDLRWATALLTGLDNQQWHDAFRAGGYSAELSDRFIRKIQANIRQGQQTADAVSRTARVRR